jgi:hypothetical protein
MTREEKIERYVDSVIEGMDHKTMYIYAHETMVRHIHTTMCDKDVDEMYNEYFNEKQP